MMKAAFDVKIGDTVETVDYGPQEIVNVGNGMMRGHVRLDLANGNWCSIYHGDLVQVTDKKGA